MGDVLVELATEGSHTDPPYCAARGHDGKHGCRRRRGEMVGDMKREAPTNFTSARVQVVAREMSDSRVSGAENPLVILFIVLFPLSVVATTFPQMVHDAKVI